MSPEDALSKGADAPVSSQPLPEQMQALWWQPGREGELEFINMIFLWNHLSQKLTFHRFYKVSNCSKIESQVKQIHLWPVSDLHQTVSKAVYTYKSLRLWKRFHMQLPRQAWLSKAFHPLFSYSLLIPKKSKRTGIFKFTFISLFYSFSECLYYTPTLKTVSKRQN